MTKRAIPNLALASVLALAGLYQWRVGERANASGAANWHLLGGGSIIGRNGAGEANYDIARGAPRLLLYGQARVDAAERALLFKQRFGVTVDPLAGSHLNQPLIAFADSYDSTVQSYVAAKFGPTALAQANRDAWVMWLARQHSTLASQH